MEDVLKGLEKLNQSKQVFQEDLEADGDKYYTAHDLNLALEEVAYLFPDVNPHQGEDESYQSDDDDGL